MPRRAGAAAALAAKKRRLVGAAAARRSPAAPARLSSHQHPSVPSSSQESALSRDPPPLTASPTSGAHRHGVISTTFLSALGPSATTLLSTPPLGYRSLSALRQSPLILPLLPASPASLSVDPLPSTCSSDSSYSFLALFCSHASTVHTKPKLETLADILRSFLPRSRAKHLQPSFHLHSDSSFPRTIGPHDYHDH